MSDDKAVSWWGSISEELEERGPVSFTSERLEKQKHLFAHRSALFYTPTENVPPRYVGSGPLDITLPVATADYIDFSENRAFLSPRFWVDLVQRQTGKLRWHPFPRAAVIFERYDCFTIREDHLYGGVKGLLDALKVRTTGRRDRLYLHYFGAIADDGPTFIDLLCRQSLVVHPKDAQVRVQVLPKKTVRMERKMRASAARSRRSTSSK